MPKTSGYVKTFKVKDGDENKENSTDVFLYDEKLLENIKLFGLRLKI